MKTATPVVDRIRARVVVTDEGCWRWTGATTYGYGVVGIGAHGVGRVHKVMFLAHGGTLADGEFVDHTCHNAAIARGECAPGECRHRACCNPDHLIAATNQENLDNAWSARATCTHGHVLPPYEERPRRVAGRGRRQCAECNRISCRKRYQNRKKG